MRLEPVSTSRNTAPAPFPAVGPPPPPVRDADPTSPPPPPPPRRGRGATWHATVGLSGRRLRVPDGRSYDCSENADARTLRADILAPPRRTSAHAGTRVAARDGERALRVLDNSGGRSASAKSVGAAPRSARASRPLPTPRAWPAPKERGRARPRSRCHVDDVPPSSRRHGARAGRRSGREARDRRAQIRFSTGMEGGLAPAIAAARHAPVKRLHRLRPLPASRTGVHRIKAHATRVCPSVGRWIAWAPAGELSVGRAMAASPAPVIFFSTPPSKRRHANLARRSRKEPRRIFGTRREACRRCRADSCHPLARSQVPELPRGSNHCIVVASRATPCRRRRNDAAPSAATSSPTPSARPGPRVEDRQRVQLHPRRSTSARWRFSPGTSASRRQRARVRDDGSSSRRKRGVPRGRCRAPTSRPSRCRPSRSAYVTGHKPRRGPAVEASTRTALHQRQRPLLLPTTAPTTRADDACRRRDERRGEERRRRRGGQPPGPPRATAPARKRRVHAAPSVEEAARPTTTRSSSVNIDDKDGR